KIKYIIFGGDALQPEKLKKWQEKYPGTKLVNMFGITETTVHVTFRELSSEDIALNISNVGGPIPTLSVYVLDKYRSLMPPGIPGELYVAGDGVARGYLNRPELTAERFVKERGRSREIVGGREKTKEGKKTLAGSSKASTLYKTGDLGRWLLDGNIEYLGRIDHQVK
ncbi:MAG: AMP-binding protein, partial [bacterium]|nr:AMP-binding protein [bacterium]